MFFTLFFFNDTATTEIYTLSLHDALPISRRRRFRAVALHRLGLLVSLLRLDRQRDGARLAVDPGEHRLDRIDRKSTRLNSSHSQISYAVFCLKKQQRPTARRPPRPRRWSS